MITIVTTVDIFPFSFIAVFPTVNLKPKYFFTNFILFIYGYPVFLSAHRVSLVVLGGGTLHLGASLVAQMLKSLPTMWKTQV